MSVSRLMRAIPDLTVPSVSPWGLRGRRSIGTIHLLTCLRYTRSQWVHLRPPSLLFSILTTFFAPHVVLHPCHKLTYFKNAHWEEEWTDMASEIVRAEYNHNYASLPAEDLQPSSQDSQVMNSAQLVSTLLMLIVCLTLTIPSIRGVSIYLTAFPPSLPTAAECWDELNRYLSTDPEPVPDMIVWWHSHQAMFPSLSRMALDYLSIPGMSLCFLLPPPRLPLIC